MKIIDDLIERLDFKNETLKQGVKYFVVGGICTILDFSLLYIFTKIFGIYYLVSSIFSFLAGVILNYILSSYWVFKVHIVENKTYEFLGYLLISLVGLALNTGSIWFLSTMFGIYFMISKLLATSVTYFWNFFGRKYILHYIKK
jgi:putative flippase GtrA